MNRQDARDAKFGLAEPDEELDGLARSVVIAAFEVHRELGPGFLESVYEEALCFELSELGIPFQRQVAVGVRYKHLVIGKATLDVLIAERLVVELKAVDVLAPIHTAQVLSYLKATRHPLGLLINFNVRFLREAIRRIILTK